MDEFSSALDKKNEEEIVALLEGLKKQSFLSVIRILRLKHVFVIWRI